jgi:hypothetical protein
MEVSCGINCSEILNGSVLNHNYLNYQTEEKDNTNYDNKNNTSFECENEGDVYNYGVSCSLWLLFENE